MSLPNTTSRLHRFAPIGALVALALAVGIFIVPLGFLSPRGTDGSAAHVGPVAEPIVRIDIPRPHWSDLTDALTKLRTPPKIAATPDDPVTPNTTQPSNPGLLQEATLHWEYQGFIEAKHPDGTSRMRAAIIDIDGNPRSVFEGQLVRTLDAEDGTARILEITAEYIIVEVDGAEQRFNRAREHIVGVPPSDASALRPSMDINGSRLGGRTPEAPQGRRPNQPSPNRSRNGGEGGGGN